MKYFLFAILVLWGSQSHSAAWVVWNQKQLQQSIEESRYGDIIFVPANLKLTRPIHIHQKRGLAILGLGEPLVDGQTWPQVPNLFEETKDEEIIPWQGQNPWMPVYTNFEGFAAFQIDESDQIQISDFRIQNSWPNAIWIKNSQRVLLTGISVTGGTNAIYASGVDTRNVTILGSSWDQDPSGEIWSHRDWSHVHHGFENYFNGAFFQSRDIQGEVEIAKCKVRNAFNAIRMKVGAETCPFLNLCRLSQNVRIRDSVFENISDNVIEPEIFFRNWVVENNLFRNVYSPFSFDGVTGEGFLLQNNKLEVIERPREKAPEPPHWDTKHQGGKILKLSDEYGDGKTRLKIRIIGNRFRNIRTQTKVNLPLIDLRSLIPGLVIEDNRFSAGTRFNKSGDPMPEQISSKNSFDLEN